MTRSRTTISLTLFAITAALVIGCHSRPAPSANGLTPIRLQADWYPQAEHGGFYTAILKGYYKAEGLDVTILPLGQYTGAFQVVASGQADFGLGSSDQILAAVSNGLPLVAVGATMQHDPQAVMVHADSPIHSFADLNDHAVAVQPGSTWFQYIIGKYHLSAVREIPATHSVANFLADPGYVQQIFVTSEPYYVAQAGGTCRTMLISTTGYDPYRVFFTSRSMLEQHPDQVAGFVRASIRGWQDYLADPGPADKLILSINPAQNPGQLLYSAQALKSGQFITGEDASGHHIGQMTADRWTTLNTQLTGLGVIHHPINPQLAYTLQFLPK